MDCEWYLLCTICLLHILPWTDFLPSLEAYLEDMGATTSEILRWLANLDRRWMADRLCASRSAAPTKVPTLRPGAGDDASSYPRVHLLQAGLA
jgi:hypothetical protein